ncbi:galactose-1-phosphate uridylyltransferase [Candidatus Latescibacterota bacterium]
MSRRVSIKRWNPILGEWVIIAPATQIRPWSGAVVSPVKSDLPDYDPECYLCPGVQRAGGQVNPEYEGVFIFDNDFPTLSLDYTVTDDLPLAAQEQPARGICRVVCFSPKHNITLPEMEKSDILGVLQALSGQFRDLSAVPDIEHVMIFENRGMEIGVSNPHPHGQIYATDFVPSNPANRYAQALDCKKDNGTCLFCNIIDDEQEAVSRIVTQNDHFIAFVPSFARMTFEVLLLPRRHMPFMTDLNSEEMVSFASIYHEIMVRYDNLFHMPFPNITIFQNSPCPPAVDPEPYHFHVEFLPPLRSRDKLKYMAGFESGGGNIINPSLPAESASALRALSSIHYTVETR